MSTFVVEGLMPLPSRWVGKQNVEVLVLKSAAARQ